ncbi:DUF6174 domain-containing protein [Streptomyces sp. NPDC097610]|uniref:DUF6174 domain-containing protein n=1 Tax=Streptomyces sp. NPDC097610 TaxID=3157227 RepID=UPI0033314059
MTDARSRHRAPSLSAAALVATLLCAATTACSSSASSESAEGNKPKTAWQEPASYTYTLTSSTQVLAGTFRVTVRGGAVTEAVGLDEDSRRQARDLPAQVPTIGRLLQTLEKARSDNADTAEAEYADDGHPVRISLDWDKNAIDDEALYTVSSYEPTPDQRRSGHPTAPVRRLHRPDHVTRQGGVRGR